MKTVGRADEVVEDMPVAEVIAAAEVRRVAGEADMRVQAVAARARVAEAMRPAVVDRRRAADSREAARTAVEAQRDPPAIHRHSAAAGIARSPIAAAREAVPRWVAIGRTSVAEFDREQGARGRAIPLRAEVVRTSAVAECGPALAARVRAMASEEAIVQKSAAVAFDLALVARERASPIVPTSDDFLESVTEARSPAQGARARVCRDSRTAATPAACPG